MLFNDLTFGLARGDRTALVARNGTGKTTLLRILGGKEQSDTGEFTFRNGIKVGYLEQLPELDEGQTIEGLILTANTPVISVIRRYEKAVAVSTHDHSTEVMKALEATSNEMDRVQGCDYDRRLKQLLDLFRITDTSQRIESLSGGEKKRLALAMVLLDEPDFLILDEPTNHLDTDMIEWLEKYLSRSQLTLLRRMPKAWAGKSKARIGAFEGIREQVCILPPWVSLKQLPYWPWYLEWEVYLERNTLDTPLHIGSMRSGIGDA